MALRTFTQAVLGGLALLAPVSTGHARSARPVAAAVPTDFDLARASGSTPNQARYRVAHQDDGNRFPKDELRPYWSYSPLSGGPKLELGALGAGYKGAPKLAHVGVDWNF